MHVTVTALVGGITLVLSILAKVAMFGQVVMNYRNKTVKGLSVTFFTIAALSYTSWVADGWVTNNVWMILGQGLGVVLSLVVSIQALHYNGLQWLGIKTAPDGHRSRHLDCHKCRGLLQYCARTYREDACSFPAPCTSCRRGLRHISVLGCVGPYFGDARLFRVTCDRCSYGHNETLVSAKDERELASSRFFIRENGGRWRQVDRLTYLTSMGITVSPDITYPALPPLFIRRGRLTGLRLSPDRELPLGCVDSEVLDALGIHLDDVVLVA